MRSDNEDEQFRLFGEHADALADHARVLAGRNYAEIVDGSPDFVIMYVPTDPILDAAMKAKPAIWQDTWQRHRVLIATPGLLIAFLRTVAAGLAAGGHPEECPEDSEKVLRNCTAVCEPTQATWSKWGVVCAKQSAHTTMGSDRFRHA